MTTILGARGWEMGNSMLNTVDVGADGESTASLLAARTGSYSLRMRGSGTWARWRITGDPSDPALSAWVYLADFFDITTSIGTSGHNIRFRLTTGEFIDLRWNGGTHTYDAYVNDVLVASGTVEVSVNDWFHVQAYTVIDNAGSINVLIDGHASIVYNGDTQPGVAAGVDYVYIYYSATGREGYIDDLVYGNGGLLGDLRVYEKRPASDSTAQWTPVVGADNYAMEDATPPNDAEYNTAATNGLADEFGLSALDVTDFDTHAVIAWSRAQMSDGVGDSIDVGINSGGTTSVNRSALSSSWEYYFGNVHEVDPATSAAWIQAGLDAVLHRKVAVIA